MRLIITILTCFSIIYVIFCPLRGILGGGGQALIMLIPTTLIFIYDKLYLKPIGLLALINIAIFILLYIAGIEYFEDYRVQAICILFGVFLFEHYRYSKDLKYIKWIVRFTYVSLFAIIIISIPQLVLFPGLIRDDSAIDYYWAISFESLHDIPAYSIPLFGCLLFEKSLWRRIIVFLLIIILLVLLILADATTPLLLFILIFIVLILYNPQKSGRVNLTRGLIVLIFVLPLLNKSVIMSLLQAIKPFFEGTSAYNKIDELTLLTEMGETSGDIGTREELYSISLDAIISNPFLPEQSLRYIGKHSCLLDHIAAMGVIMIIPFAILIISRLMIPLRYLTKLRFYYMVSFAYFVVLGFMKNYLIITSACGVVPLCLILLENKLTKSKLK